MTATQSKRELLTPWSPLPKHHRPPAAEDGLDSLFASQYTTSLPLPTTTIRLILRPVWMLALPRNLPNGMLAMQLP